MQADNRNQFQNGAEDKYYNEGDVNHYFENHHYDGGQLLEEEDSDYYLETPVTDFYHYYNQQ